MFEGTGGTILVGRGGIRSTPAAILKEPLGLFAARVYQATDHRGNWLDCIRTGATPICPAETGHRSATVYHLGNIGYRLGRKLTWDPAKELFTGDDAANKLLTREPRAKWKVA